MTAIWISKLTGEETKMKKILGFVLVMVVIILIISAMGGSNNSSHSSSGSRTCYYCGGSGWVSNGSKPKNAMDFAANHKTCPKCHGTGVR